MKRNDDIRGIVAGLRESGRMPDVDDQRLAAIFDRASIALPAGLLQPDGAEAARREVERRLSADMPNIGRRSWYVWVAVPAAAIFVAAMGFLLFPRFFAPAAATATVREVRGGAHLLRGGATLALASGMELRRGDGIVTAPGGRVDIETGTLARLRVTGSSCLVIERFIPTTQVSSLHATLSRGGVIVRVQRLRKGDMVALSAPGSRAVVRGTVFMVQVTAAAERFDVIEGKIEVNKEPPASLPPSVAETLRQAYRKQTVVVSQDQACRVNPDHEALKALSGGAPVDPVHLTRPLVEQRTAIDPELQREAADFLKSGSADRAGGARLLELSVELAPAGAILTIDGQRREQTGGRLYLAAGEHDVAASAPGYQSYRERVTIQNDTRRLAVHLLRANPAKAPVIASSDHLVYEPGMKYMVRIDRQGIMEALHAGATVWKLELGAAVLARPVTLRGVAYLALSDRRIMAVALDSGKMLWQRNFDSGIVPARGVLFDGSALFVTTNDRQISRVALDGAVAWQFQLPEALSAAPAIADAMILAACDNGDLVGIDRTRGTRSVRVYFRERIQSMAVAAPVVFLATTGGTVYSYRYTTDEILWKHGAGSVLAGIAAAGDSVYLYTISGEVTRLLATGRIQWKRVTGNRIVAIPQMDAASIYIPSDNSLCIIERSTGEVRWSLTVPGIKPRNMAVSPDAIYYETGEKGVKTLRK